MNLHVNETTDSTLLQRIRAATAAIHQRLEHRLDAVERLADPSRRRGLIARFAALHLPAEEALAPLLADVEELAFDERRRTALLSAFAHPPLPAFPSPGSRAEALGMLYVLEGSTLGGRVILDALARRGVRHADLRFLDPYGPDSGRRWRAFLSVLAREAGKHAADAAGAVRGAMRGFAHAERVLCGDGT